MLGDKIRKLRGEHNLTQKELADLLYVSPQAVSRWENGDVEPSITTLRSMAQIFNISLDKLLSHEVIEDDLPKEKEERVIEDQEEVKPINPTPVLAVCEICNEPIYNPKKIVRRKDAYGRSVVCSDCVERQNEQRLRRHIFESKRRRKKAFIVTGIIAGLWLVLGLISIFSTEVPADMTRGEAFIGLIISVILLYTFPACIILNNNFLKEAMGTIFTFGFVRFPGIIFSLDFGGIIFLITVKILFLVLGMLLVLAFGALALFVGVWLSVFVYPFALYNNYKKPEKTELKNA
ncbi:MAG TPA: helix-turn-helix domain-containing protein [Acholeplasma sp.]|jgi:transcriptional regulator with XRE-family HTH domain|nr:helix-turn-helix domain-containing protein [Acholeplasma sp.]